MITLISFVLVMLGAANWLCIGLMQYDFVAGFFGTQSSFLSRLIYIVIGFGAIWFLIATLRGRGTVKINSNGFGKKQKNSQYMPNQNMSGQNMQNFPQEYQNRPHQEQNNVSNHQDRQNTTQNVELGNEIHERNAHTHQNPFD